MTVRWKPLLVLSGLFLAVGLAGVLAFNALRGPSGTASIVAGARAHRRAGRFDEAEVDYRRALQADGRDPSIHRELASLYEEWLGSAPAPRRPKLEVERRARLADAARFGPTLNEPRLLLLRDALDRDDAVEADRWANEVLKIDAADPVAHAVVASAMLDRPSPNVAEVKRHLEAVDKADPRPARADWLAARLAQVAGDDAGLRAVLVRSRSIELSKGMPAIDAMALFRLRALDVRAIDEPATLADRAKAVLGAAEGLTSGADVPSSRIGRIAREIEGVQAALARAKVAPATLGAVEAMAESVFRKAIDAEGGADLGVHFAYADHLRFRDDRKRCLDAIEAAFRSPASARQAGSDASLSLHALAVHAILTDVDDKGRLEKAGPHIKSLLDAAGPRFRALGHMYQGQVDLERSSARDAEPEAAATAAKARASAMTHLKAAADDLPDLSEAQARYGVALILGGETDLGRVYLQKAAKLGDLEPRYQVWAAWAMVHGGYPEYAEPIVADLLAGVESGRLPKEMASVLYLVSAEIHQARRSPEELGKAIESYQKAFVHGQKPTASVQLRLAEIEVLLKRPDAALARLAAMDRAGMGGPGAEKLAIDVLRGQGKPDAARARLASARAKYPRSPDLVAMEAEALVAEKKAAEAEALLKASLDRDPGNVGLAELRAWLLSESLGRPAEARAVLAGVAEQSDRTSPMVRLAQLDIRRRDFDAAAATIAKVRARWREAAVGDMLDAQLALARGNNRLAATHYEAALKKDPGNKLVRYWKAQLDGATDPRGAARALESLASEGSVKEIDAGLPLMTAARSALANLQAEAGDLDGAIARYRGLIREGASTSVARELRWKLVAAESAKHHWPAARAEIEGLLNDPASPPTVAERVAAAMAYRDHDEPAPALALLDAVLKEEPANPWAVAVRVQMLVAAGSMAEARGLIRRALGASPDGAKTPVAFFLLAAAVENGTPPVADALKRAMVVVEGGLAAQPDSLDLVQAKCRLLGLMGDRKAAIAFAESKAKASPKGPFPRLVIGLHREARDYASAERAAADLLKAEPEDAALAASLARIVADRAAAAKAAGDRAGADAADARASALVREFRGKFPADPAFVQLDCELAIRRGDAARAVELTREVDATSAGSAVGSLLRAGIYASQGRTSDVVAAYTEALDRDPRQPEIRLRLAQADLRLGDADRALRQARLVLEADPERPDAVLVEARALAMTGGSASQAAAGRAAAADVLRAAIARRPGFAEAYHLLAEVLMSDGGEARAIEALRLGLKAVPTDANGLSIAVRILSKPAGPGKADDPARLAEARAIAEEFAARDPDGSLCLATAVGFHRSGRLDLALPWAERAAKLADNPTLHLNFGDLLLSLAEARGGAERDGYLARAVAEFDRVLKDQPGNVEAANNKAWILHSYLHRSREALALAEGVAARAEPSGLPAEFHDTLGAIREATGRAREAEEAYRAGLAKAPDLPVLNYHLGKLIAADGSRRRQAATYIERAMAGRDQLPPEAAADVAALARTIDR